MSEKHKEVEKMISKVMRKKDLSRNAAIDYMLGVATGRLNALWRYDDSLPEGKKHKGILAATGRKKRAPKTSRLTILPGSDTNERKQEKPRREKKIKRKSKPKKRKEATSEDQMIIEGAAE